MITSPKVRNKLDLPHPFGPHTKTLIPDLTSNDKSFNNKSPFGVTRGTCSNLFLN
jgi:hypothetical protein